MRAEETPTLSDGAEAADDLGPVILEQKSKPLAADIFLVLAVLLLIPTALMPFVAPFRVGVVVGPICAIAGTFFAMCGILHVLTNANKASYLHELGLRVRQGKGWRVVRYRDVTEMTFRATRMYYNGAYTGTVQEVGLKTDEGGKPIVFRHTYREKAGLVTGYGEATPLNHLCNVLADLLARRMADRLGRGESVPWTRSMWISTRGVETKDRAGRRDEVDWDRIARVDVERGVFRLWVHGEQKPRVQVPVAEPNFFPGYVLVAQRLRGQPPSAQAPAAAIPVPRPPAVALTPTVAEGRGSIRIQFTPTVDDRMALQRWHFQTTPEGRRAWARRVWTLPVILIGIGLLIGLANLFVQDVPEVYGIAAVILIVGLLLRPLLGWLMPTMDRARVARELRAAQNLGPQDPFLPREVVLGPQGYVLRTRHGDLGHGWNEISRVEEFDGYLLVFLAADRVRRETVGLTLPPRALQDDGGAHQVHERIEDWREAPAGRPMF